jgi:hypothetical protein
MDTTRGEVPWGSSWTLPFYTRASIIVNGRVVATDYAPDAGWLIATPGAQPGDVAQPEATNLQEGPFPVRLSMTLAGGWTEDELTRTARNRRTSRSTFIRSALTLAGR